MDNKSNFVFLNIDILKVNLDNILLVHCGMKSVWCLCPAL